MPDSVCHVVGSGGSINNIDYVTGIGNSSREQYVHAGNLCCIDLPKKTQKCTKIDKKWPKIEHF